MPLLEDQIGSFTVPITSGFSTGIKLKGLTITEFFLPVWSTTLALVPYSSDAETGTYLPMYDDLGNAISFAVPSLGSAAIVIDELIFAHRRYVKFKSDGQAAARTVKYRAVSLKTLVRSYDPA